MLRIKGWKLYLVFFIWRKESLHKIETRKRRFFMENIAQWLQNRFKETMTTPLRNSNIEGAGAADKRLKCSGTGLHATIIWKTEENMWNVCFICRASDSPWFWFLRQGKHTWSGQPDWPRGLAVLRGTESSSGQSQQWNLQVRKLGLRVLKVSKVELPHLSVGNPEGQAETSVRKPQLHVPGICLCSCRSESRPSLDIAGIWEPVRDFHLRSRAKLYTGETTQVFKRLSWFARSLVTRTWRVRMKFHLLLCSHGS